eukprot:gene20549-27339_t
MGWGFREGERINDKEDVYDNNLLVSTYNLLKNIDSWVLGWRFIDGERITDKQDVFNDDKLLESISLFDLEPSSAGSTKDQAVAVESLMSLIFDRSSSQTSNYSDSYQFSFWARRGKYVKDYAEYEKLLTETGANTSSTSTDEGLTRWPMGIGYPADMFFNNMWCDKVVMTTPVPNAKQQVAVPELSLDQMPKDLSVSHFPSTLYYGTSEVLSSLQFNCVQVVDRDKLSNTGSNTSVNLDEVTLQYWFDAPLDEGSTQELENYSDIASVQFSLTCSDISTILSEFNVAAVPFALTCSDISPILRYGCDSLQPRFSRGLPGVKGAGYRLDLGFYPGSGYLLPRGSTNESSLIKQKVDLDNYGLYKTL